MIPSLGVHRVWTQCADISDHYPICFEWNKQRGSCNYPFKFNRSWLNDPAFSNWLTMRWPLLPQGDHAYGIGSLYDKLCILKNKSKVWIKDKEDRIDSDFYKLD